MSVVTWGRRSADEVRAGRRGAAVASVGPEGGGSSSSRPSHLRGGFSVGLSHPMPPVCRGPGPVAHWGSRRFTGTAAHTGPPPRRGQAHQAASPTGSRARLAAHQAAASLSEVRTATQRCPVRPRLARHRHSLVLTPGTPSTATACVLRKRTGAGYGESCARTMQRPLNLDFPREARLRWGCARAWKGAQLALGFKPGKFYSSQSV